MTKTTLRKTFLDLIVINEIYPDEDRVIRYTEKRLDHPRLNQQRDAFNNLIIKTQGTGEPILLSTHLDIPEPAPIIQFTENEGRITADGTSILGADPKTGLAVLIEFALWLAKQDKNTVRPVEFVLTRGEETGLYGAINLDYSLLNAQMGVVLDEDGPVTQVVTQAPAFVRIDAQFIGKAGHPRDPKEGINALQAAAKAINSIPLGYSTAGVTWNIGFFNAGTARNTIPGLAELKGELRSYDTKLVVSEGKRIEETFRKIAGELNVKLDIERELEFEGFKLEKNHALFHLLEKTYDRLDLKPHYYDTFGGSDANIFNAHGIKTVPIGSGYYNAHQYTEIADLNDMVRISEFLKEFTGNDK